MYRVGSEENEYLLCPYEKTHKIRKARMQVHLIKCRKNHPTAEVATCPFNVLHVVNKLELEFHVTICSDRANYELFLHRDMPSTSSAIVGESAECEKNASSSAFQTVGPTWNDDVEVPTYNPANYVQHAAVLRNVKGLTPSQRREFRQKERERLLKLVPKKILVFIGPFCLAYAMCEAKWIEKPFLCKKC